MSSSRLYQPQNKPSLINNSVISQNHHSVIGIYFKSDRQFSIMVETCTGHGLQYYGYTFDKGQGSGGSDAAAEIQLNKIKYNVGSFQESIATLNNSAYHTVCAQQVATNTVVNLITNINKELSGTYTLIDDVFRLTVQSEAEKLGIYIDTTKTQQSTCCPLF